MRKILISAFLSLALSMEGQVSILSDTIRINEIVVMANQTSARTYGYRETVIDSAILSGYSHKNLSDIISQNTPVFIKSYGSGGIATTSFRGTGPGHTVVTWNDIDINSTMLGQSDLSLIPAGFIDRLAVLHGNAASPDGRGSAGGIINIMTEPEWTNEKNVLVNLGAGSFGKYSALGRIRAGSRNFQSATKLHIHRADNNFRYLNDVAASQPFYERRQNAETGQVSVMQEFFIRNEKRTTSAHFWNMSSDRNLPTILLNTTQPTGERQHDESLRSLLSHERYISGRRFKVSAAFISDRLDYFNSLASISSYNRSDRLILSSGADLLHNNKSQVKVSIGHDLTRVRSVNYAAAGIRNISSFLASANTLIKGKALLFISIKEILADSRLLIPDFSAGMDLCVIKDRRAALKFNYSRSSRLPSLNDLYWNPGGNPGLRNEYTYSGEASLEIKGGLHTPFGFESEMTFYSNSIMDLIQWRPGEFTYWSPINLNEVRTNGLESMLKLNYNSGLFKASLSGNYAFTRARIVSGEDGPVSAGRQLIYIPENMFNVNLWLTRRNFHSVLTSSFTGRRFTTTDNSAYLPSYSVSGITVGHRFRSGNHIVDVNVKADNIFNADYQAIAYYPMPGRSFLVSVIYQVAK